MTEDEVTRAIRCVKAVPLPPGVKVRARRARVGNEIGVRIKLVCGDVSSSPITIVCEYESTFGRLVSETAKRLADACCAGAFDDPAPPVDEPGDGESCPKWMKAAVAAIVEACPYSVAVGAARRLALTILGDIEADDLQVPYVRSRDGMLILTWRTDGERLHVACSPDGLHYTVTPEGFGPALAVTPFTVKSTVRNVGGSAMFCSRPELLRYWIHAMFCDQPKQYGWDADIVLDELGWWSKEELEALDDFQDGPDDGMNERETV
jgi:hypothetical protein